MYIVQLSASCVWDRHMSVLFPHSFWMESQASLAVPVVTSYNTKTSNIRAVEGDVASCELVTKYLFIGGGVT